MKKTQKFSNFSKIQMEHLQKYRKKSLDGADFVRLDTSRHFVHMFSPHFGQIWSILED
jgi:hypothetical protein